MGVGAGSTCSVPQVPSEGRLRAWPPEPSSPKRQRETPVFWKLLASGIRGPTLQSHDALCVHVSSNKSKLWHQVLLSSCFLLTGELGDRVLLSRGSGRDWDAGLWPPGRERSGAAGCILGKGRGPARPLTRLGLMGRRCPHSAARLMAERPLGEPGSAGGDPSRLSAGDSRSQDVWQVPSTLPLTGAPVRAGPGGPAQPRALPKVS